VLKVSVWAMFIAHSSVRFVKKCALNGNSAPQYGLWSSGKVWLELIERKCSYGVICQTRLDMYLWIHAIHILSKVGMCSAIGCKF
jgi:hypothetical protein